MALEGAWGGVVGVCLEVVGVAGVGLVVALVDGVRGGHLVVGAHQVEGAWEALVGAWEA